MPFLTSSDVAKKEGEAIINVQLVQLPHRLSNKVTRIFFNAATLYIINLRIFSASFIECRHQVVIANIEKIEIKIIIIGKEMMV